MNGSKFELCKKLREPNFYLLITASSSTSLKTRFFGFPGCGCGVMDPISTKLNPSSCNPGIASPSLSNPAARPTGWDRWMPQKLVVWKQSKTGFKHWLNLTNYFVWIKYNQKLVIQWGSEYRTSLVFKRSKTVCSSNGLLFRPCLCYETILLWLLIERSRSFN